MGRGTEGLIARWTCGAACLPVALSWGTRNNAGHAFDSLDICIISYPTASGILGTKHDL